MFQFRKWTTEGNPEGHHSSNIQKAAPRRNYPYKTGQRLVSLNCRKTRLIRDCKGFPEEPEEAVKSPLEEEGG